MNEAQGEYGAPVAIDTMGIDMPSLIKRFNDSEQYVEQYTRDFVKLDNLVDGVPLNKAKDAPSVGDTTLAGLVRSIPRSSLKQLPVISMEVNGTKKSVTAFICNFLLKETAFNEDTFGKGLLSTLQIATEAALTHGYQPVMVAAGSMYDDYGTRMRMTHYSDTSLEPGVSDSNESGWHFVKAHLTPSRVRKMVDIANANPETSWNVPALESLLESTPPAKNYNRYLSDPKKASGGLDEGVTYEFVTCYETGPGATFVTFSVDMPDAPLRVIKSKSKWGYPRVQYLVIDPAQLSPFGISRVRLASPNQNFMNIYYGNIAMMLLINSRPPIFKKGLFTKPTELKQGAVWETSDPNAEISLKVMDNGALGTFTTISAQLAAQIQNMMGGQSMTVNAGAKAAPFGKTAPGVEAGQQLMNTESNQVTKILENFLRQYALVALDTLFSEQTGDEIIIVDDDTKNLINEVAPDYVGDDNQVQINWEDMYASIKKWKAVVDVSLSPDEMKDKERGDLQDMLTVLGQNAQALGPEAVAKVQEITNLLMQDKAPLVKPLSATPAIMPTQVPQPSVPQPDQVPA